MSEPYKIEEVYQYTETVYYDASGYEVARERNYDDTWYDSSRERKPVSEQEIEDYYEEGKNR